ncbi:hypothetical protein KC950_01295 [Candidatus Saccharibacteria bacterium]|nr:hypothetical protein [Candidatus Saccharibacteria bacterium]
MIKKIYLVIIIVFGILSVGAILFTDKYLTNDCANKQIINDDDSGIIEITEEHTKKAQEETSSQSATIVILNTNTNTISASFTKYSEETVLKKCAGNLDEISQTTDLWEPGSVIKPLVAQVGIDQGVIKMDDLYYLENFRKIDSTNILNSTVFKNRPYTYEEVITNSINTGAVHILERIGNGNLEDSRKIWHDYLTGVYELGKTTGYPIENEQLGFVPSPNGIINNNLRYAQTSFGIGLTVTPSQLVKAYCIALTGRCSTNHKKDLSDESKVELYKILNKSAQNKNSIVLPNNYSVGGKTGTSSMVDTYGRYTTKDIGSYIGFVKKNHNVYIILVKLVDPQVGDSASYEASNVWNELVHNLINHQLI